MKKVLSLVLAVVLVLGMGAVAFGTYFTDNAGYDKKDIVKENFRLGLSGSGSSLDKYPEDKVEFALTYVDGGVSYEVNKKLVRDADLGVQIRTTAGSAAVKSAEIKYKDNGNAYVKLTFVDEYVATKELDFDITLYLTSKKSRIDKDDNGHSNARIDGTFANYETQVDEYDEYVYLYDQPVVEALDYIKNIKVDLGEGVAIYAKMFEGKKYYGKVSQEVKAEDEAILAKYPDIDTVYYLKTIGLSSTGNVVAFDLSSNLYAYAQDADGNLVYIGRSNDKLPYYNKYFLSSKELDVDVVGVIDDGDAGEPETPGMGGDDAPVNANDNPSTGR